MSDHVVCIVQARLGSTRFPRKVLMPVNQRPMVVEVLRRAGEIRGVHTIVAAIPDDEPALQHVIASHGQISVDGHPTDVLARYYKAAWVTAAEVIVRITADCPAFDPRVAEQVLQLYFDSRRQFASNDIRVSGFPDGWDVQVFSRRGLNAANLLATDPGDREHVCPWMQRHLSCATLHATQQWCGPKLSVDTPEDLAIVKRFLREHRGVPAHA